MNTWHRCFCEAKRYCFGAFAGEKQSVVFGVWTVMIIAGSRPLHTLGVMAHSGLGVRWTLCGHVAGFVGGEAAGDHFVCSLEMSGCLKFLSSFPKDLPQFFLVN